MSERKVSQIHQLKRYLRDLEREFNAEITAFFTSKQEELAKIDEKVARLDEIDEELKVTKEQREALWIPAIADTEQPGKNLEVNDDEVTVEKFMSAEEKAKAEAAALAEENRRNNANALSIKRALDYMMGGSLEVPKQNDLELLEKPDFLETMDANTMLSEEQQKALKDYEKRLKQYLEDKEKQRKVLEAEAKKLRREIEEVCENFDERLRGLWDKRLEHDAKVHAMELQMLLLGEDVNTEADLAMQIVKTADQVELLRDKVETANVEYEEMKRRVDDFREQYEGVLVEDKQLEKQFRREFADHVELYDTLFKLFKKRRYANRDEDTDQNRAGANNLDPFATSRTRAEDDDVPMPEALDPDEDMLDGVDQEVWDRLVEVRDEKIQVELDIKRKALNLGDLNRRLLALQGREEGAVARYEAEVQKLEDLRQQHTNVKTDLRMLVKVKQGQLESNESGNFSRDDLVDAVLVDRNVLQSRNEMIRQLGQEKVHVMKETKDFKRKIHMLRWDTEVLDAKSKGVAEDTRYYQLLRVTKALQEMIKGGVKDKNAAEVATLEKQLEHAKDLHEIRIDELKRKLFKVHRNIREKELENEKLEEYVQDLAVSVAQRDKILQVRASEQETSEEREYRMQELVWRRLVLEEARQQSEDIDILKAEIDRLRQRTFPSFAKSYSQNMPAR